VKLTGRSTRILGRIKENDSENEVSFYPAIAFNSRLTYEFWQGSMLIGTFRPDKKPNLKTRLLSIYPQDSLLPENLLKIHLVFSSPMGISDSYQYIDFFHEQQEVFPILDLQPELWNDDRTVLTLWLDPGRIKRELLRQTKLGRPLASEAHYRMVIDSTWRDRKGNALEHVVAKDFWTGGADRSIPTITADHIRYPKGPQDTLTIEFQEPMDYLLLRHAIWVKTNDDEVLGRIITSDNERTWHFSPEQYWTAGEEYQLIVETRLEDLAGNNLTRPFDRMVGNTSKTQQKDLVFPFRLLQSE
ncbi:MAG: Ig-like domain-containing protein, partial [Bacteroidota bacterium]